MRIKELRDISIINQRCKYESTPLKEAIKKISLLSFALGEKWGYEKHANDALDLQDPILIKTP